MQNVNNIKKGIYAELNDDATLSALITGVYGIDVPDGTAMPYVTFFVVSAVGNDNFSNTIDNVIIQVDCYAQKSSTETAQDIAGQVSAAVANVLDDATLTITSYHSICCRRELTQEFYEPTIEAHRYLLDYRIMVNAAK